MFWCIVICICDCLLICTCSCIYLCNCIICICIGQQQYHHCIKGEGCCSLPPFSSGINEPLRLASPRQSPTEAFFILSEKNNKKMPLLISLLSRLLSTKGGLIHTCKKRVMLRRRLFWPKKIAEKVRKSRQNVNRDKSA